MVVLKTRWQGVYGLDGDVEKNITTCNNGTSLCVQSNGARIEHRRGVTEAGAEAQPSQPDQTVLQNAEGRLGRGAAQPLAKKEKAE